MRQSRILFIGLLVACQSVSFPLNPQSASGPTAAKQGGEIIISAAADLHAAFTEIGVAFEKETGTRAMFNFGSTGQLAQQIAQGAPVDLFAAADRSYINDLAKRRIILSDTVQLYARGRITLWTREDSAWQLQSLTDLTRPEVKRVAIANPEHAPYGLAAREALQNAGVWDTVQPKLVFGENVAQTKQLADTGNVDAAIIALSLSVGVKGRWTLIPQELHSPLDQALGVVTRAKNERGARAFIEFVNSPAGRTVMAKHGFILPDEEKRMPK
ncbi:MAG: molybdate ABC transporter substrate-binding protein [Chloroflexi bacterium]|nr:molybdate ABC transporter substrate-binding protein [Chloroflexota bacterium]